MAPRFPDEIDVFTVPHSRMKELVNIYTQKMQRVDFRDGPEVLSLLQDLLNTLNEFKSHESIENIYIMDQLKNRLKQRQIVNSAVCDCHNDNRLSDVFQLVRTGSKVRERSIGERIIFGQELKRTFQEFVKHFLPHMEEEEEVFQPLLVEYFEYDELKILKEVVLREHESVQEIQEKAHREEPEIHGVLKDLRDLDLDICCFDDTLTSHEKNFKNIAEFDFGGFPLQLCSSSTFESQVQQCYEVPSTRISPVTCAAQSREAVCEKEQVHNEVFSPCLPSEILVEIFQYLAPPDLGRCAQVCSAWNDAAYSPPLWRSIYPIQWARGIWKWHNVNLSLDLEEAAYRGHARGLGKWDEDADVDEIEEERDPMVDREHFVLESLVNWVLPRIGEGVGSVVLDTGRGLTSRQLQQILLLCPNITTLSAAYTQIDYYAFKGLWLHDCLQKLHHLDLQGCEMIEDTALEYLAQCSQVFRCPLSVNEENFLSQEETFHNDLSSTNYEVSSEYIEDKSYTLQRVDSVCHYCGHCNCWCSEMSNLPLNCNSDQHLQVGNNFISNNHSLAFSLSQGRKKKPNCKKQTTGRMSGRYDQVFLHSEGKYINSNGNERDIEEICCSRGSQHHPEAHYYSARCTKLAYEGLDSDCGTTMGHSSNEKVNLTGYKESTDVKLMSLNLSGCWRITDDGLLALVDAGVINSVSHLELSGCFQLTGKVLEVFVESCPSLQPQNLFYCDNIIDGPYATQANGCANLCNPVRVCCRTGQ